MKLGNGRKKNHPNKSAVKLHLRFDVATGTFEHFQLTDGITDSTAEKQMEMLPPGSLRLADSVIFRLKVRSKRLLDNTTGKLGVHSLTLQVNPFVCKSGSRQTRRHL